VGKRGPWCSVWGGKRATFVQKLSGLRKKNEKSIEKRVMRMSEGHLASKKKDHRIKEGPFLFIIVSKKKLFPG